MCAKKIKFSEAQLKSIVKRYIEGELPAHIAASMGCSRDVIRARLIERKVTLRTARKNKKCILCSVALSKSNTTWYRQKNYIYKCNDCIKTEKAIQANESRKRNPKIQAERSHRHNKNLKENKPKTYTARQMCSSAKKRSEALGLSYDLDSKYIESICSDKCPVFDIEMKYGGGKKSKYSASLDRIAPLDGYIKKNVRVVSLLANTMKNEASPEEMISFAEWVLKTYGTKNKTPNK